MLRSSEAQGWLCLQYGLLSGFNLLNSAVVMSSWSEKVNSNQTNEKQEHYSFLLFSHTLKLLKTAEHDAWIQQILSTLLQTWQEAQTALKEYLFLSLNYPLPGWLSTEKTAVPFQV